MKLLEPHHVQPTTNSPMDPVEAPLLMEAVSEQSSDSRSMNPSLSGVSSSSLSSFSTVPPTAPRTPLDVDVSSAATQMNRSE